MSENPYDKKTDHEMFIIAMGWLMEDIPLTERALATILYLIDTEEKEVRFLEWIADHVRFSDGPIPYTEADLEMVANDINQNRPPRDLEQAHRNIKTRIEARKKQ